MKLYIAGSLFSEAEVRQRKYELELLKKRKLDLEIFSPIEQPFNKDKSNIVLPLDIFEIDSKLIENSDIFIADVSNEDPGVMLALGIAIYTNTKLIIGVNSDIRLDNANKYDIPSYSMNHFVLGALEKNGRLVRNFEEAIDLVEGYV